MDVDWIAYLLLLETMEWKVHGARATPARTLYYYGSYTEFEGDI